MTHPEFGQDPKRVNRCHDKLKNNDQILVGILVDSEKQINLQFRPKPEVAWRWRREDSRKGQSGVAPDWSTTRVQK